MNIADVVVRIRADVGDLKAGLTSTNSLLGSVGDALSTIGKIAGGILLAELFNKAAEAVKWFVKEALSATETMQALKLQIHTLAARELANTINAVTEAAVTYRVIRGETETLIVDTQQLREAMADNVQAFLLLPPAWQAAISSGQRFVRIQQDIGAELVYANAAFDMAGAASNRMINQLRRIAVISPYTVQTTTDVFRLALAFQWSSDESMRMTKAMLNVAAGLGATTEMVQRMTFNFAQIRMQGKIMARDFWELGKAGFDLMGVLKELAKQTGYTIRTHLDFNKLLEQGKVTWADFVNAFESMADKNFGGAAQRMAYTLLGLKSTLQDVFKLSVPEILIPTVELVGKIAEKWVNAFLGIVESGAFERLGRALADTVQEFLAIFGITISESEAAGNAGDALAENLAGGFIEGLKTRISALAPPGWLKDVLMNAFGSGGDILKQLAEYLPENLPVGMESPIGQIFPEDLPAKVTPTLGLIDKIVDAVNRLGTAFGQFKTGDIAGGLTSIFTLFGVSDADGWATAILKLAGGIGELAGALGRITAGVVAPITNLFDRLEEKPGKGGWPSVISDFADTLTRFADWIDTNGESIIEWIQTFTTVLLGIGAVALIVAILSTVIGAILGIATVILLLAVGIATLKTAWDQNWGGIQDKVAEVGPTLQGWFNQIKEGIQKIWDKAVEIFPGLETFVTNITKLWEAWKEGIGKVWELFGKLVEVGGEVKRIVFEAIGWWLDQLKDRYGPFIEFWAQLVAKFGEILTFLGITAFLEGINDALQGMIGWVGDIVGAIDNWIGRIDSLIGWLAKIDIPAALLGGSPPPLATWIEAIANEFSGLNRGLMSTQRTMSSLGGSAFGQAAMVGQGSSVNSSRNLQIGELNINTALSQQGFNSMARSWLGG